MKPTTSGHRRRAGFNIEWLPPSPLTRPSLYQAGPRPRPRRPFTFVDRHPVTHASSFKGPLVLLLVVVVVPSGPVETASSTSTTRVLSTTRYVVPSMVPYGPRRVGTVVGSHRRSPGHGRRGRGGTRARVHALAVAQVRRRVPRGVSPRRSRRTRVQCTPWTVRRGHGVLYVREPALFRGRVCRDGVSRVRCDDEPHVPWTRSVQSVRPRTSYHVAVFPSNPHRRQRLCTAHDHARVDVVGVCDALGGP